MSRTKKTFSFGGVRMAILRWEPGTILPILALLGSPGALDAQTPSDAAMMSSKNICILTSYDMGSFDRYWEGSYLRSNGTIATVDRNTLMPMAAVGILDDLNFYIGLPYVSTESSEPNGGKFTGSRGFQDLILALKYRAIHKNFGSNRLSVLATVGFSTPLTNYLSDYRPYSIGAGAPELSLRAIGQYQWANGLYFRASLAHLWRGYTEAERDYYYNDGSYYTPWMDVPSAWTYEGVFGKWFFNNSLKFELGYFSFSSTSGDDIRPYNAAQPTNRTESDQVGLSGQYFLKSIKGLGILVYHNRVVDGRNVPKMANTGIGINYQFAFTKKQTQTDEEQ